MQNTRAKISVYLMSLTVGVSCVLRFFQLKSFTDSDTGCVVKSSNIAYYIYAVIAVAVVFAGLFAFFGGKAKRIVIDPESFGSREFTASALLSVTFFGEFVYQAYSAYSYFTTASYLDYIYFIPLICSSVFALLSCFYFSVFSITAGKAGYDFRNFVWMHFMPVIWGISSLIIIMVRIVDTARCIETVLQFLFLIFFMAFVFCFISSLDSGGRTPKLFGFSSTGLFIIAVVMVIPRLAMIIAGNAEQLCKVSYFGLNYLMLGIFALILSCKGETVKEDRG